MKNRLKILFLCTGNSCGSQTAGFRTGALQNDVIETRVAGDGRTSDARGRAT
jgi:protein-tyrosine-phosphatase